MSETKVDEEKPKETKPKKTVGIATVALGIICILLIIGLGGAMAYYVSTQMTSLNNQIASLNNQIASLKNQTTSLDAQIKSLNAQIITLQLALIADLQNRLNVSSMGEVLLLKVSTTSDWTAFACLNGSIFATPFNSSSEYAFSLNSYNAYPVLGVNSPNLTEKTVFCLVMVNPNYVYSLGKGDIGWATYQFYSVTYQSGSWQIGSEILSLQATAVGTGGHGALDGTLFKFP